MAFWQGDELGATPNEQGDACGWLPHGISSSASTDFTHCQMLTEKIRGLLSSIFRIGVAS